MSRKTEPEALKVRKVGATNRRRHVPQGIASLIAIGGGIVRRTRSHTIEYDQSSSPLRAHAW
jgi:hypothetical protein